MSTTKVTYEQKQRAWTSTVLAFELALSTGDIRETVRLAGRLDFLAGKNKAKREVVHEAGNAAQRLIFQKYLNDHPDAEHSVFPDQAHVLGVTP